MSTPTIEAPAAEAAEATSDAPRLPVWHNAATWEDLIAALRGEPYTAKCGARCHGKRGVFVHRSLLPPMEKCIVCADLWGVAL